MAARRPTLEESFEDFVEGVGRVPTQPLKKALVGVYQVIERAFACVRVRACACFGFGFHALYGFG